MWPRTAPIVGFGGIPDGLLDRFPGVVRARAHRPLLPGDLCRRLAAIPRPPAERHFRREGTSDLVAPRRAAAPVGKGRRRRSERAGRGGTTLDPVPPAGRRGSRRL